MTTITIQEDLHLEKTTFISLEEVLDYFYEESLEKKLQASKVSGEFIDF